MSTVTQKKQLNTNPALRRYDDVRELIASPENPTPLLKVQNINPAGAFQLYVKLEWFNPFGSIKDRIAKYLLEGMENRGELTGKQIVEFVTEHLKTQKADRQEGPILF